MSDGDMEWPGYIIGFTGARDGMTDKQKAKVQNILAYMEWPRWSGLHGDCLGADEDFHNICRAMKREVLQRPCILANQRAYTDAKEIAKPKNPLVRNKEIVDQASGMIACPSGDVEQLRSGTWSTIRYARLSDHRQLVVVFPDGRTEIQSLGSPGHGHMPFNLDVIKE